MNQTQRILLFLVLPILAPMIIPPNWSDVTAYAPFIVGLVLLSILASIFQLQARSWALTLTIFLQGLNVIVRLMMFWPHFTNQDGSIDFMYVLASMISIALSTYLVLRLDKVDVRVQMVR